MRTSETVATILIALLTQCVFADVVVVVGAKSPVGKLDGEQVRKLFMKKSTDFPSGGSASILVQNDGPVSTEFDTKYLKQDVTQMRGYWAKLQFTGRGLPPQPIGTDANVKKLLAANPKAIGYIDKGAVDGTVKVVATEP